MSANNIIYIEEKTHKVYYQSCADNDDLGELIGKGKNLEDAIKIAQAYRNNHLCYLEYGIEFI